MQGTTSGAGSIMFVIRKERKSWFSCSVSPPIAPNVDMAWYPEKMIVLPLLARWL